MEKGTKRNIAIGAGLLTLTAVAFAFRKGGVSDRQHVTRTIKDTFGPEAAEQAEQMTDEEAEIVSTAINPDAAPQTEDYEDHEYESVPSYSTGPANPSYSPPSSSPAQPQPTPAPAATTTTTTTTIAPVVVVATPKKPTAAPIKFPVVLPAIPKPVVPVKPATPAAPAPRPGKPAAPAPRPIMKPIMPVAVAVKAKASNMRGLGEIQVSAVDILKKYGIIPGGAWKGEYTLRDLSKGYTITGEGKATLIDGGLTKDLVKFRLTGREFHSNVGVISETNKTMMDKSFKPVTVFVLKSSLKKVF